MMLERGFTVDHTTVYRLVQAYAPELMLLAKYFLILQSFPKSSILLLELLL
jgi:hypothetical protein